MGCNMNTKYVTPKDKAHWLEMRKANVNSTDSSALFRMHPKLSEMELYYEKKTGDCREFEDNMRMKAGRKLEPFVADIFSEETRYDVRPFKDYAVDEEYKMGSSFDYEIISGELEGWLIEIKVVDYIVYRDNWFEEEAPEHIETQVQHQLEMTGREGCMIVAWVGGNTLKMIARKRNQVMGQSIRNQIAKFWDSVERNEPPEPDYKLDADFIIAMHQSSGANIYDATEEKDLCEKLRAWKAFNTARLDLEKKQKALKAEILDYVGNDYNQVVGDGVKLGCGMTKGSAGKIVTPDMLGQTINSRAAYRRFDVRVD